MQLRQIARLDDWYRFDETGPLFITGLQALVRLTLAQSHRDRLAGRNTAGFVSGYRGSPLGGLDRELWRAAPYLDAAQIRFRISAEFSPIPAVNTSASMPPSTAASAPVSLAAR